jgi:peptidoglycan/LPS O-acetylase OafA/YrhL
MKGNNNKLSNFNPNVLDLLDFCKGLAIIWVFLIHYQKNWFGWQGVHIFIVLSGFGLTYSCLKKNQPIVWSQWFLKRAEKILPSYWLVCLSGFITNILFHKFIYYNSKTYGLLKIAKDATSELILDLFLLRNFYYKTLFGSSNASLWFIPLIISFYLVFPWLYAQVLRNKTIKGYLLIILGAGVIEFIYRGISIYCLDGLPIGHEQGFLGIFPMSVSPLNRINPSFLLPFQQGSPFGLFPSRLAEFVLGMIGAIILVNNSQKFHRFIFSWWTTLGGMFIWLFGNTLLYVGLWGWIFTDFVIAIGLFLWIINLAWICKKKIHWLFLYLSQIGTWSYYIFLTHLVLAYGILYRFSEIEKNIVNSNLGGIFFIKLLTLITLSVTTWLLSLLLIHFNRSRLPQLIIEKSIARFLNHRE